MSRSQARIRSRSKPEPLPPAARVAGHRVRQAQAGRTRVEIVVPVRDIALIRQVAARLRASPAEAEKARTALTAAVAAPVVRTGAALVRLLRSAPGGAFEVEIDRDRALLRDLDLDA